MTSRLDIRKRRPGTTARARRLRREETDAEYRLWYRLRHREIGGYKFLRQVPLGPYVVDFLCRSKRLVVEIDGEQHAESIVDAYRTAWLNARGYSVLRFWNFEALREREAVLDTILAVLEGRIAAPSPDLRFAPATLSPVGRGTERGIAGIQSPLTKPRLRRGVAKTTVPLPTGERSSRRHRNDAGGTGEGAPE